MSVKLEEFKQKCANLPLKSFILRLKKRTEKAAKLAAEIDEFSHSVDTYEYWDTVGTSEKERAEAQKRITTDLATGNTQYLVDWLNNILAEDDSEENCGKARDLKWRILGFEEEEE